MEFKQFLDNWEYIAYVLGGTGLSFGGFKAWKVLQKQKDKGQDSRIRKNAGDIRILQDDMKEVKSKQTTMRIDLDRNLADDIEFRKDVRELQKDTNKTVKGIEQLFTDFLRKDWVELIKEVYKKK